jgi:hypothetical protein
MWKKLHVCMHGMWEFLLNISGSFGENNVSNIKTCTNLKKISNNKDNFTYSYYFKEITLEMHENQYKLINYE